jgi:hypothetical protein
MHKNIQKIKKGLIRDQKNTRVNISVTLQPIPIRPSIVSLGSPLLQATVHREE